MSSRMYGWYWPQFKGSESALNWARRDCVSLDEVIKAVPKPRRVVVQAGGNLGIFPKRLAKCFETVYTFEPAPDSFAALQQNAPEDNIVKFQAALGCERGLVGLSRKRRDHKPDAHEGITYVNGAGRFPVLRIDDLGLSRCDLIYLDVEGYEYFALQGGLETIDRCRPVIAVEINKHLPEVGIQPETLRNLLFERGYRFVVKLRSDELYVPVERAA